VPRCVSLSTPRACCDPSAGAACCCVLFFVRIPSPGRSRAASCRAQLVRDRPSSSPLRLVALLLLHTRIRILIHRAQFIKYDSGEFNLVPYYAGVAGVFGTVTALATMLPIDQAQNAIGWLGCAVVVSMLGGPLTVIKTVIDEKSTKSLPFPMAVMTTINASLWLTFGYTVVHDPFVWGPNVLGVSSGVTQLALFAKYGMPPKEEAEAEAEEK